VKFTRSCRYLQIAFKNITNVYIYLLIFGFFLETIFRYVAASLYD